VKLWETAYWPRVVDGELRARLASTGAVVLEGPKACGKTFTARQAAASEVLFDTDEDARAAAALDPRLVLEGPTPRLLDEWQLAPTVWNSVRRVAEERGLPGQFILSGSTVPEDDETRHSGAGRISRIQMRPMSLFESGHSTGAISLAALLSGEPPRSPDTGATVPGMAERIAVGGWPGFQRLPARDAVRAVASYLDEIRRVDMSRIDHKKRNQRRVGRLLHSLARNIGTAATLTRLIADTGDTDQPLARETVEDYLSALERLMIIEDQLAWAPHLRSRHQLRTSVHRHFVDPSLAVAALGASPERLLKDLNLLGLLFESLVIRDLRIYAQASDGVVLYYRDNSGLEIDTIVDTADGRWAAFEVELGGAERIEEGVANLLKFARRIDTEKRGQPACLGVIVANGYGYVREDGVAVIPLGALKS
jgi:uncharacterized protein